MGIESIRETLWHLRNTGFKRGKAGADVNAASAWKITLGSPDVRVVVHDTGIDIEHPALKTNIGPGRNFDDGETDSSNFDDYIYAAHGTACAGVVAATGAKGIALGIAPNCRITPLRIAGSHSWEIWGESFEWAAQNGEIITCSWVLENTEIVSDAIRKAVKDGRSGKGIPCFFPAGNQAMPIIPFPASMPETITVGASTNEDLRAAYSNFGEALDFLAPSSGGTLRIETTDIRGEFGYNRAGDYCLAAEASGFGGTSSATALAAGVAALMLSANPDLTAEEVREIMRSTADKIDPENAKYVNGRSYLYGYGRINAGEAVKEALRRAQ